MRLCRLVHHHGEVVDLEGAEVPHLVRREGPITSPDDDVPVGAPLLVELLLYAADRRVARVLVVVGLALGLERAELLVERLDRIFKNVVGHVAGQPQARAPHVRELDVLLGVVAHGSRLLGVVLESGPGRGATAASGLPRWRCGSTGDAGAAYVSSTGLDG